MDPMTAMMIAGGVTKLVGGIAGGIQKNKLLKLEAERLDRNKMILQEQRQSQGQIGSMRLGEMLGQAMMSRLGGGLAMSGSVLESESQNHAFRDLSMRQGMYQTDLQGMELDYRIQDNQSSQSGLLMSTILDSMGVAAASAGNIYSQQAKVPSGKPASDFPIPAKSQSSSSRTSSWASEMFA
jgi:hypothetical protein